VYRRLRHERDASTDASTNMFMFIRRSMKWRNATGGHSGPPLRRDFHPNITHVNRKNQSHSETPQPAPAVHPYAEILHANITHVSCKNQSQSETPQAAPAVRHYGEIFLNEDIPHQQNRRATHPKGKIKTNRFHPTLHLIQVESGSEMEC